MRVICSMNNSLLLTVVVGVCTMGVGLPLHAYEIASPPFAVAEQSISDDTTQDAQESPDDVPQDPAPPRLRRTQIWRRAVPR